MPGAALAKLGTEDAPRADLVGVLSRLGSAWTDRGKGHAPKTGRRSQELYGHQPGVPSAELHRA